MKKRRPRMNIILTNPVITPVILMLMSIYGICINKKNIMFILVFMEVVLICLTILFSILLTYENNLFGQYYAMLILTLAAVESAILICLVVQFFRCNGIVEIKAINSKKKKQNV